MKKVIDSIWRIIDEEKTTPNWFYLLNAVIGATIIATTLILNLAGVRELFVADDPVVVASPKPEPEKEKEKLTDLGPETLPSKPDGPTVPIQPDAQPPTQPDFQEILDENLLGDWVVVFSNLTVRGCFQRTITGGLQGEFVAKSPSVDAELTLNPTPRDPTLFRYGFSATEGSEVLKDNGTVRLTPQKDGGYEGYASPSNLALGHKSMRFKKTGSSCTYLK